MWKKLLLNMALGYASKEIPGVKKLADVYEKYGKYGKPLKRAVKAYEANRKQGLKPEQALMEAAAENDLTRTMLAEVLSHVSPEIGQVAMSSVLGGTVYDGSKPNFKFGEKNE